MSPTNMDNLHTVHLDSMKGEDVVITGISARLPESDNMEEFRQNLINKRDMITADSRRWEPGMWRNGGIIPPTSTLAM